MPPNPPQKSPFKQLIIIILDKMIRIIIYALIVVLICVILVSLLAPEISRSRNAKFVAAKQDISDLETALDAFSSHIGRYPTTKEGLNALITNPNLPNWRGPYLKRIPTDPWGDPYLYRYSDKPTPTCLLSSNGPDKQPHTDDDITNYPINP